MPFLFPGAPPLGCQQYEFFKSSYFKFVLFYNKCHPDHTSLVNAYLSIDELYNIKPKESWTFDKCSPLFRQLISHSFEKWLMAITCSYNEKVKVSLQVLYCQTSFFGLPGIIVSLIPDTNTNKKINMSTCFNMNIAIYTVAVKQISREYVVFILGIKYKIPRLKSEHILIRSTSRSSRWSLLL